jgi:hypothetical protein
MESKSPEQELEQFLAQKPPWLRKAVQRLSLTDDEQVEMAGVASWPEEFGQAHDEYLQLLELCPDQLREYRIRAEKDGAASALFGVPRLPAGAPRKDWLAQECWEFQQAGMSQPEIARELNLRHPNLTDKKGNLRPITEEVVRKQLAARRKRAPEKPNLSFFRPGNNLTPYSFLLSASSPSLYAPIRALKERVRRDREC